MTDFSSAITDDADQFSFYDIEADAPPAAVISQRASLHVAAEELDDGGLFDVERPPPVSLADRFLVPPFSVLDRRSGDWQDRKRRWLSLGISSDVGRAHNRLDTGNPDRSAVASIYAAAGATSVFDPVICELVYRWFGRPGGRILDPFAGGSVRGVVASTLARWYLGIDVRQEQVDANREQLEICSDIKPQWIVGDATKLGESLDPADEFDLIFSCPPYAGLEVYSDHPRDISTWTYDEFVEGHRAAIIDSCARLRDNRYAAWVIGDVRDKKRGTYYGLHHRAIEAFEDAGLRVVNECAVLNPPVTAGLRAAFPFIVNRKLTLTHQHLLVFVKGDVRKAARLVPGRSLMGKDDRLYAKFTLDFPDCPKIMPLPVEVKWAYVEMVIYSRRMLTDGYLTKPVAIARWGLDVCLALCTNDVEKPSLIEVENGYQIHDFCEIQSTRAEIEALTEKRKAAGQKGGMASVQAKRKQVLEQNASKINPETETETEIKKRTTTKTCATASRAVVPPRFEDFWAVYPRRRDRRKAEKAFANALKRADPDTIIAGAHRYAADPNRTEQFTKYAEGWLNGDGWRDEPLPARNGSHPPRIAASDAAFAAVQAMKTTPPRLELTT